MRQSEDREEPWGSNHGAQRDSGQRSLHSMFDWQASYVAENGKPAPGGKNEAADGCNNSGGADPAKFAVLGS